MITQILWIDVAVRKPNSSKDIFIHTQNCKNKISIGKYDWEKFVIDNIEVRNVEFWAEIPNITLSKYDLTFE